MDTNPNVTSATTRDIVKFCIFALTYAGISMIPLGDWAKPYFSESVINGCWGAFGGFFGGLAMILNNLLDHKTLTMKTNGINDVTLPQISYVAARLPLAQAAGFAVVTLISGSNSAPHLWVVGFLSGYSILIFDILVKALEKLCGKWSES